MASAKGFWNMEKDGAHPDYRSSRRFHIADADGWSYIMQNVTWGK